MKFCCGARRPDTDIAVIDRHVRAGDRISKLENLVQRSHGQGVGLPAAADIPITEHAHG